MNKTLKTKAFTLIEVLVVTSIIALLASITNASLSEARNEAQDKKKIEESRQVNTALEIQRNKTGSVPLASSGSYVAHNERSSTYQNAMQELVDNNAMPSVPRSDSGKDYYYLVDDSGNGVFGAILESESAMEESNGCYFTDDNYGCSGEVTNYPAQVDRDTLISNCDSGGSSCTGVTVDTTGLEIINALDDIRSRATAYKSSNGNYVGLCSDSEISSMVSSLNISYGAACVVEGGYNNELISIDYGIGVTANGIYYGADPTGSYVFDSANISDTTLNWWDAKTACSNAGKRLPGPLALKAGGFDDFGSYWSYLESPSDSSRAYFMFFGNGNIVSSNKIYTGDVRCVH